VNRHVVARVGKIAPCEPRLVAPGGRAAGVFNVNGENFALLNRCPHQAETYRVTVEGDYGVVET
jgi:nitrite reductase/ring-hydroxylating ferredoxin subunit